jgi:hypothetical protein
MNLRTLTNGLLGYFTNRSIVNWRPDSFVSFFTYINSRITFTYTIKNPSITILEATADLIIESAVASLTITEAV